MLSQKDFSTQPDRPRLKRHRSGFSMTEIVVVISIISILATMVILMMHGAFSASKETLALSRLEMLNSALNTWSSANRELTFMRMDAVTTDEFIVLRDLQFRNPNPKKATFNAPYMPPEYNPKESSSIDEYRFRWTGRNFELLRPGQPGVGLLMVFDSSDYTAPFIHKEGYQPGSR
jgi:prepilin-type N-terminal cleavage/methylation domain-containing protein